VLGGCGARNIVPVAAPMQLKAPNQAEQLPSDIEQSFEKTRMVI
jgi:hypothetical protein